MMAANPNSSADAKEVLNWLSDPPDWTIQDGSQIIRVTTLADSGAGSLREALYVKEPRVIVFEVGGIIWLERELEIRYPFVHIAGQTAPSPGITLAGAGLRIRTHDVELRHLRVRIGDRPEGPDPGSRDGIKVSPGTGYEAYNVLIENCSVSWAIDENVATSGSKVRDVVVRNCIISEGLYNSIHPKGPHSCGLLVGDYAQRVVVVGNLFAHNFRRNPCLKGNTSTVVVNNVIYNARLAVHSQDPEGSGPVATSIVGKVLLPGPDWAEPRIRFYSTVKEGSKVYLSDNQCPKEPRFDTSFDLRVDDPPWWPDGLAALPCNEVLDWVLANVGARPWDRDAVDRRIVADVRNGTGRIIDSQGEVDGWPSTTPTSRTLNLPDRPYDDDDGDGLSNLEEWLYLMEGEGGETILDITDDLAVVCTQLQQARSDMANFATTVGGIQKQMDNVITMLEDISARLAAIDQQIETISIEV